MNATFTVDSKYKTWNPWKSLMVEMTMKGMSDKAAAKIADAEMKRRTASINAKFENARN